jgi:SPP1 family predicted phage head-tail adaptor
MSKEKAYDAGRFNRQLTIENEIEIADGCGGYVSRYEPQDTVWAHVCPMRALTLQRADNSAVEISHRILVRFRANISSKTRFVTGSRRFEVEAVKDPDETRRYLECDCVERK